MILFILNSEGNCKKIYPSLTKNFKHNKLSDVFYNSNIFFPKNFFMISLEDQAIKFSMSGLWKEAIKLNLQILKKSPKDIDAINRLTFAYIQTGKTTLAKKMATLGLKIDRYNVIANKNLLSLTSCQKKGKPQPECLENNINFIENPGTTKLITLVCPGEKNLIAKIRNGAELSLKIKRRRISAIHQKTYIGCFPDDLSRKFIALINQGLEYELFFKSYKTNKVCVLLREIKSAK
jgi:hypothetical protein